MKKEMKRWADNELDGVVGVKKWSLRNTNSSHLLMMSCKAVLNAQLSIWMGSLHRNKRIHHVRQFP